MLRLAFISIILLQISPTSAQDIRAGKGQTQVNQTARTNEVNREAAFEFNRKLGRGINYMAAKIDKNAHHPYDFELIKANHFTHVRLGSHLWKHVGVAPEFMIDATKLQEYKNAVDWALAEGLMVIMDPIHYWRDYTNADLPMLLKMWEQFAIEFALYPVDRVTFEIMNEPESYDLDLQAIIQGSIDVIRSISGNEKRMIIVAGQSFSTRQALIDAFNNNVVFPADDPYLIGTFHYYDPRAFSKQGAGGNLNWADEGDNDPEWDAVASAFDEVVDANNNWAMSNFTTPLPIYDGEYGIDNGAPAEDRLRWLWWVRMMNEERGFSQSLWNLYSDGESSKGFGPWTNAEINDPYLRYLDQTVMVPYRNRYEAEAGTLDGEFIVEARADCSGDSVVTAFHGQLGDMIELDNVYMGRGGEYDATLRYQNRGSETAQIILTSYTDTGEFYDSVIVQLLPSGEQWIAATLSLNFQAGSNNKVTIDLNSKFSALIFDYLAISKGPYYDNFYPALALEHEIIKNEILALGTVSSSKIKVYPNPAQKAIHIEGNFQNWIMTTVDGVVLSSGSKKRVIIDHLKPGMYLLVVDGVTQRLLIK